MQVQALEACQVLCVLLKVVYVLLIVIYLAPVIKSPLSHQVVHSTHRFMRRSVDCNMLALNDGNNWSRFQGPNGSTDTDYLVGSTIRRVPKGNAWLFARSGTYIRSKDTQVHYKQVRYIK